MAPMGKRCGVCEPELRGMLAGNLTFMGPSVPWMPGAAGEVARSYTGREAHLMMLRAGSPSRQATI
jgi:hypothetical protein